MPRIFGIITERLLKQHGEDSPGWTPPRSQAKPSKNPAPPDESHKVGKGEGRKKG